MTLKFLNEQVGENVRHDEMETLHGVPLKRKDKKRIVIVHFKSRARRDEILSSCKSKLGDLNKDLDPDNRIYVNEHLSPENKRLFAMATKKKYELGYKYIWSKNGVTFLKKDDSANCPFHKINSEEMINEISE